MWVFASTDVGQGSGVSTALYPAYERTGINSGGALTKRKIMITELKPDIVIWESLPAPVQQNLLDLNTLFPYLGFTERLEWLDKLREVPQLRPLNTGQLVRLIYTPPVIN